MDIFVILQTMVKLFLLLVLGFVLFKVKIFDEHTNKKISALIVNVTAPLLIINSIAAVDSGDKLIVFKLIGIGIVMYVGFALIGKIVCRLFPRDDWPVYECMCIFANTAFMGYPVLISVYGDGAVFHASLLHMAYNLFIYTYAIVCLTKSSKGSVQFDLKNLLTPGISLLVVAVVMYLFDIQLPSLILEISTSIGNMTSPLSMMMIGSSLAVYPIKECLSDKYSYIFAVIRLFLIPFITMVICRVLGVDPYFANVAIITNAMPVGSMVLMMATQYNANVEIVTKNIIVSTLLSVITIPIVVATMMI